MSDPNQEQVTLVIDGDDVTRQLLSVLFADSGKVVSATSGEEDLKNIADTEEALSRADKFLYQAKDKGRNRVIAA